MARPGKTPSVLSVKSARAAKQRGLAPKLQELSLLAETLQSEVIKAESELKQLTQHEQVLQHIVYNKDQVVGLLSGEADSRTGSSSSRTSPSKCDIALERTASSSTPKVPPFPEHLILQAKRRTWQCWNELHRGACQQMALLLARLESPALEAASAAEELHQAVKQYNMQLALMYIHCQGVFPQCISRNCDTGEVSHASAEHWQHVAQKAQYNEEQKQALATGFSIYSKAQQQLLQQRAPIAEQLQKACTKPLLGAYGYVEVEELLDQLMANTKRMSQAQYTLGSLLWTTVSSPKQKAQLVVASYPYWVCAAAGQCQLSSVCTSARLTF